MAIDFTPSAQESGIDFKPLKSGSLRNEIRKTPKSLLGEQRAPERFLRGIGKGAKALTSRILPTAKGAISPFVSGVKKTGKGFGNVLGAFSDDTFAETAEGQRTVPTQQGESRGFLNRASQAARGLREVGTGGITALVGATPLGLGLGAGFGALEPEIGAGVEAVKETDAAKSITKIFKDIVPPELRDAPLDVLTAVAGKKILKTQKPIISPKKIFQKIKTPKRVKTFQSIEKKVAPKVNAKESAKIIKEGRVIKGKQGKIFGKKADTVIESVSTKKIAETVKNRIPKADKLDEFQLSNKMGGEIKKISTQLKPKLKTVPVDSKITSKIFKEWDKLKKAQSKDPEFKAFKGSTQAQKNFQEFLNELKKPFQDAKGVFRKKNFNDVWKARVKYDGSISSSVKKATDASAPSTQLQNKMWLSNRAVLNDMIKKMSEKLGIDAKKAFSDMNRLYEGRNNISTSAKVQVTPKGGLGKEILKSGTAHAVGAGLGAGAAGAIGAKFLFD